MDFKTLGEWLRHRRLKLDISPFKMAEDLGYKRVSAIYNFEYGVAPVPMAKWPAMAKILDLPLDRFLDIMARYAPLKVSEFRAIQAASTENAGSTRTAEEILPVLEPIQAERGTKIRSFGLDGAALAIIFRGEVSDGVKRLVESRADSESKIGLMEVSDPERFNAIDAVDQLKHASTIAILEGEGGQSLATAVKAAFLDALTGAAGFPHIHRVPKIYTAILESGNRTLDAEILKSFLQVLERRPDERTLRLSDRTEVRA